MASGLPAPNDCCDCADGSTINVSTLDAYITTQVTGSTVGYFAVNILNDARALPTATTNRKVTVWGRTAVDDGYTSVWRWNNAGTDADDGNKFLRPDDYTSAGVWVRVT